MEPFLSKIFEHHVNDRFPNVDENIRQGLVRAMILRRKRILYRRHRQGLVAIRPQKTVPKTAIKLPLTPQASTPASGNAQGKSKDGTNPNLRPSPSLAKSATTLDPDKFKKASSSPSTVSASKTIALDDHECVVFPPNPGIPARRKYEKLRSDREAKYRNEVETNGMTLHAKPRFESKRSQILEQ